MSLRRPWPRMTKAIEQLEVDRGTTKRFGGSDAVGMVAQERLPALARPPKMFDHALGNTRLGDFDAELEQLAVDSRGAPQSIHPGHLANQIADLPGDRRPTMSGPRF